MHVHRVNSTCQHTILFPDSKAKVGAFLPSSKVHEADFYLRKTGDENSHNAASKPESARTYVSLNSLSINDDGVGLGDMRH